MARVKTPTQDSLRPIRPALTPEGREKQMISLAMDLVEKRLREGTASSQETTHFLKLAASDYQLKLQKLEEENRLSRAKSNAIEASESRSEDYKKAIEAMRLYSGNGDPDDY